ncbi:1310_t:CDS:2, partial [Acaulospora colombiana]
DTFRRERSLTYQSAKRHAVRRAEEKRAKREEDSADAVEKGGRTTSMDPATVKVTLIDLNPFKPIWSVLTRKNNLCILFPSALLFAFQYSVCFTAARTFAAAPYNYDPLHIGLVLLSFGLGNHSFFLFIQLSSIPSPLGNMFGSVLGGRWSDWKYNKLRVANGGHGWPEMRLRSTIAVMIVLPPSVLAFAWTCQKHTHIAGPVVTLFVSGFTVLTLAYIVDANAGRSTAAVASNSSFRGLSGMIASEIAAPLQDSIGDGGLYTMWAGLLVVMELMILVVIWKGKSWREEAEKKERVAAARRSSAEESNETR